MLEAFESNCKHMGLSEEETAKKWEEMMERVAGQDEKPRSGPPAHLRGFRT